MTKFLLSLLLLLQASRTGVVTGVVRNNVGMPAAGVRVYAMALSESKDGLNPGTVLESISQTDEAGRYRLEVPAGRYYIAAGSVESPTYFPGTSDVTSARVISITSAAVVESIDFSGYVPPAAPRGRGFQFPPQVRRQNATGALSGVIQYPDGSPAAGLFVSATPSSLINVPQAMIPQGAANRSIQLSRALANLSRAFGASNARSVQTDRNGRYRFDSLPPDNYYIATGFLDSPTFYPGVADLAAATAIPTTPATNLATVDFTIPVPPRGTTVRGTIFGAEGKPAANASVYLELNPPAGVTAFLPARPRLIGVGKADGSFEITGALPGTYSVEVSLPGTNSIVRSIVVAGQPVDGLQFSFPIATLFGEVLWEDGSPFSGVQALREVAVTTVRNRPNALTTILPLDGAGKFSRVIEFGEYRFFIPVLPEGYTVNSITSGGADLLKESLKITSTARVRVEVRVSQTRR